MAPLPGTEGPLKRETILSDNNWIYYCFCTGCGVTGKFTDPVLIAAEAKNLCLRTSVSTADVMGDDGLINQASVCLCITQQCQVPPLTDAPLCACFNKKCGNSIGTTAWKKQVLDQSDIMGDNTFWLNYMLCGGCGVHKPFSQGVYSNQFKQCCCRGYTGLEAPVIDGVVCSAVSKEVCIQTEFQLPPAANNPMIAICTWRLKK